MPLAWRHSSVGAFHFSDVSTLAGNLPNLSRGNRIGLEIYGSRPIIVVAVSKIVEGDCEWDEAKAESISTSTAYRFRRVLQYSPILGLSILTTDLAPTESSQLERQFATEFSA